MHRNFCAVLRNSLLLLILMLSLIFSSCTSATSAKTFTDVADGSWYYDVISYATEQGMISGTSTTTFSPDTGMTRGQFIAVLRRALGASDCNYKSSSSILFSDVKPGSYYEQPIYWAVTRGIVSGTGYGQFSPDRDLTRQDMAVIIQKAMDASGLTISDTVAETTFRDASRIADYAKNAVSSLQKKGLLAGDPGGYLWPEKTMTRAEGTTVLVRLMKDAEPAETVSETFIPEYAGSPYAVLNNNVPQFTSEEKKCLSSYERYSELDELGRTQTAMACLGRDLMPTDERETISSVRPTGWHLVRYDDLIEDHYLYNRCHIIGFQLTGENANERNLFTGTRHLNVDGMLPFENIVASYIRRTGNHVIYRVTPVFEGSNLLASGIKMEAYSVEDSGTSVQFNVFCFNVQPGVIIDYSDGYSQRDPDYYVPSAEENTSASYTPTAGALDPSDRIAPDGTTFVLNTNTMVAHRPGCASVMQISERNIAYTTDSLADLEKAGYRLCGACRNNSDEQKAF